MHSFHMTISCVLSRPPPFAGAPLVIAEEECGFVVNCQSVPRNIAICLGAERAVRSRARFQVVFAARYGTVIPAINRLDEEDDNCTYIVSDLSPAGPVVAFGFIP